MMKCELLWIPRHALQPAWSLSWTEVPHLAGCIIPAGHIKILTQCGLHNPCRAYHHGLEGQRLFKQADCCRLECHGMYASLPT
jgi:hypothetical protein